MLFDAGVATQNEEHDEKCGEHEASKNSDDKDVHQFRDSIVPETGRSAQVAANTQILIC